MRIWPTHSTKTQRRAFSKGILLEIAIGSGIGLAMGNLALGMGPGLAIGIVLGASCARRGTETGKNDHHD